MLTGIKVPIETVVMVAPTTAVILLMVVPATVIILSIASVAITFLELLVATANFDFCF